VTKVSECLLLLLSGVKTWFHEAWVHTVVCEGKCDISVNVSVNTNGLRDRLIEWAEQLAQESRRLCH
jgi:hypothetical protein